MHRKVDRQHFEAMWQRHERQNNVDQRQNHLRLLMARPRVCSEHGNIHEVNIRRSLTQMLYKQCYTMLTMLYKLNGILTYYLLMTAATKMSEHSLTYTSSSS